MQLVEQISATVNARGNIIENREASGGIEHLVADLTKARQLLKYKPRTRLKDGLRKFYELDPRFNVKAGSGKVLAR
jgi:nucleoside-diphosphate-sugar epimerase